MRPGKAFQTSPSAEGTIHVQTKFTKRVTIGWKKLQKILSYVSGIIIPITIVCGFAWVILGAYQAFNDYVHPPPDKTVWEVVHTFGYTPNTPNGIEHTFIVPKSGSYRVVCTQGYTQHNLPAFADDYIVQMPCDGGWIPGASRKYAGHNLASQIVIMNGHDVSNGQTSIKLIADQRTIISAMTNIGLIRDAKQTLASVFKDNTGTVQFSIQRLIVE